MSKPTISEPITTLQKEEKDVTVDVLPNGEAIVHGRKSSSTSEPESQPTENVPAEVRIPFLNDITRRYKIEQGPISPNKGSGRHHYYVTAVNDAGEVDFSTEIHFQEGPLNEGAHNGILSIVLLAILRDHFQSFQEGEFVNRETAIAITQLEDVMYRVCARADERAARGVLGQHKK